LWLLVLAIKVFGDSEAVNFVAGFFSSWGGFGKLLEFVWAGLAYGLGWAVLPKGWFSCLFDGLNIWFWSGFLLAVSTGGGLVAMQL
jgi:hypothetical protein